MGFVDLHVHSTMSDGSFTPAQLVHLACEKGLCAFALTDQDSVAGIYSALSESESYPVRIIPGVEITSVLGKHTIHILGYCVDHEDMRFVRALQKISNYTDARNIKICSQLRTYGIDIEYDEFREFAGCRTITRDHFAAFLVAGGYVADRASAYNQYLGKGRPCYMPRQMISTHDAVKLILNAGGVPVVAHPKSYRLEESGYIQLFSVLKSFGVKGVEAIYSDHTHDDEMMFTDLAQKLGLFITGGSEFCGMIRPDVDLGTGRGSLMIPEEILRNLPL